MLSYLGRNISSYTGQARVISQLSIYGQWSFPSKMLGKPAPVTAEEIVKLCSLNTSMLAYQKAHTQEGLQKPLFRLHLETIHYQKKCGLNTASGTLPVFSEVLPEHEAKGHVPPALQGGLDAVGASWRQALL